MTWNELDSNDLPQVLQLMKSFYKEDPSSYAVTEEHFKTTISELQKNPTRGKILVLNNQTAALCGYALIASFWSNELGGELCVLDELYVTPEYRQLGHATRFIQLLIKNDLSLWPQHFKFLELEVSPNNASAQLLYTSLGFKTIRNSVMRRSL